MLCFLDPLSACRIWLLLLSRRISLGPGGTPYLVAWPELTDNEQEVKFATNYPMLTVTSELTWNKCFDAVCSFFDLFGLTNVVLAFIVFRMAQELLIRDQHVETL